MILLTAILSIYFLVFALLVTKDTRYKRDTKPYHRLAWPVTWLVDIVVIILDWRT